MRLMSSRPAGGADRLGLGAADLEAVVLDRVVRRGGHDAADGVEVVDREVDERRVDHADVDHVHPDRAHAVRHARARSGELGRMSRRRPSCSPRAPVLGSDVLPAALEELRRRVPDLSRRLRRHGDAVYDALTVRRSRFVRVEDLVIRAAGVVPAWCRRPRRSPPRTAAFSATRSGQEIDQGLFLSAVLGSERSGRHLCHAMLLPRPEARGAAAETRA